MSRDDHLNRALESLELTPDDKARARLVLYLDRLGHWNRSMNLTALQGFERALRLVAEPLWVARRLNPSGCYVDIGSGNGSPAFPWLLLSGFQEAHLVEARRRRAVFLRQTARALDIREVKVHPVRFDEFVPPAPVDWVTLQGVRLTSDVREKIGAALPGARIVWLTERSSPPAPPTERIQIPGTNRCALVFDV